MKKLLEFVQMWTSGHKCQYCDEATKMLRDIQHRKDGSVHSFQIHITCHKELATEFHISIINSK